MLGLFLYKIKHKLLTLRFSILFIFISLFVSAMLIVIGVTYFRYSNAMSHVSFRLMKEAAQVADHDLSNEIKDVSLQCQFTADLISNGVLRIQNQNDMMLYTLGLMRTESATLPSVQSAYWGDEAGNFILSNKASENTIESETIYRTPETLVRQMIHRNLNNQIIKVEYVNAEGYDPRTRPWYVSAKQAGKLVWTDVIPYRLTGFLGATVAIPVYDNARKLLGVFALNMRLDYLRNYVESLKVSPHGSVFIVTEKGKVVAFPGVSQFKNHELMDVHALKVPWIVESFDKYKETKKNEFVFQYAGDNYFAIYQPLPYLMQYGWVVAVVAPENDFISELFKTNFIMIVFALIILMLGIWLMSRLVYFITNPMLDLVRETERVRLFQLHDTARVKSRIKEVIMLSDSIRAMKQGLRLFQKYVPALLVRQILETRKDILTGGEKKHLAILFSDIEDFTGIAEKTDSHHLMRHLCEYFNEMSYVISNARGTIDKYIGDSLMAFWGAPLPEESPCQQAARTALLLVKHLSILNTKWRERGQLEFYTRIGLHYGEVIVGNIGSDERLNYTAIGDAINLTSRLEGVNKIYGSQILVSDAVYQMIKDKFVFRFLDCVTVKGKTRGVNVYELLTEFKSEMTFDLDAYQVEFNFAYSAYQKQQWDEAIIHFEKCLIIHPADKLAHVYIVRCVNLKNHPPELWDGIWRVREK